MDWEGWFTLLVLVATIGALTTERISPPFAILGAVAILLVVGVVDEAQAFAGFSNPAPITVAALYVLAAGVEKTGALESLTTRLLGAGNGDSAAASKGERRGLLRVLLPTATSSSFLNNTTIVAMVAPAVISWARRSGRSASRYLMPISFAAILGGVVTLIGTSTNLVVSGLLIQAGSQGLGFFEIGRAGLPFALVGLLLLVVLAPKLLPPRRSPSEEFGEDARQFTVEMLVEPDSPIVRQSVAEAGLRNLQGVFLVERERAGHTMAPVPPDAVLEGGDRLTFAGNVGRIVDLQRIPGLVSAEERHFPVARLRSRHLFFEAVVAEDSVLSGSTLKAVGFRARYGAAVLAVHRAGERIPAKLGEVVLRPGDVLLVLGPDDFHRRWRDQRDFLLIAALEAAPPPRREKAPVAGGVLLGVLALAGTGVMDILHAALLAAMAMVVLRVLTPLEARNAVDLNVIVIIAASFGLGAALAESGLADEIAGSVIAPLGEFGNIGLLLGVLIATSLLTELITNNAAAVLMFPIATATAAHAGLDARGFVIAVALGASASFLSPIGYQTNTMVYGMGGYHFGDFARVGLPLSLTLYVTASVFIPLGWPLG